MRVLCTGGLGFIGSHVVTRLLAEGHEVIIIDNRSNSSASPPDNVRCLARNVAQALADWRWEQCDFIFHLAAPVGPAFMRPETEVLWQIVRDAHAVLKRAKEWKAKVIAFSTPEVFGREGTLTEDGHLEVHLPYTPRHEYPVGKLAMECMGMAHAHPLIHFIRPYIVSGKGQNPAGGTALVRFCHLAARGEPLTIFGTGEQRRQFTHIDDCLDFCWLLLERDDLWREKHIWNLGGADAPASIRELAARVIAANGGGKTIMADPVATLGNPYFIEAPEKFVDTSKACSTGWHPKRNLDQIIKEMLEDAKTKV